VGNMRSQTSSIVRHVSRIWNPDTERRSDKVTLHVGFICTRILTVEISRSGYDWFVQVERKYLDFGLLLCVLYNVIQLKASSVVVNKRVINSFS
jgi:hypothetical protein